MRLGMPTVLKGSKSLLPGWSIICRNYHHHVWCVSAPQQVTQVSEWVALAHALEVIPHRDFQYSKESQGKCPGDWEPKQGTSVCP